MKWKRDPYDFEPLPRLIIISGPSGVGKDVAIRRLAERGYSFYFVVNATSRPRRPDEVEGRDYFFVSREEFEEMIERGELLEYAVVYGDYKGVPKQQIRRALASGLDVVVRIDVQGAATIRRLAQEAVFIFLMPGSEEELARRLQSRSTEDQELLQQRLDMARAEIQRVEEFDYVVFNRDGELDEAVDQLIAIITAEKCRVHQREVRL